MKYISTRSKEKEYSFGEVFLKGLADDGGLYVPKSIKKYNKEENFCLFIVYATGNYITLYYRLYR